MRIKQKYFFIIFLFVAICGLVSCRTAQEEYEASLPIAPPIMRPAVEVGYWNDPGAAGPAKIVIQRQAQRALLYKGNVLVGISPISSGKEGFLTPPGTYSVIQKSKDYKSGVYGAARDKKTQEIVVQDFNNTTDKLPPNAYFDGASMPYFLRFYQGYGMHEGLLPGFPASHGCVRMPGEFAERFFNSVKVGTPVIVE